MPKKTAYIVELTRDEAVAMAMFDRGVCGGRDHPTIRAAAAIGAALRAANPSLDDSQLRLWEKHGGLSIMELGI